MQNLIAVDMRVVVKYYHLELDSSASAPSPLLAVRCDNGDSGLSEARSSSASEGLRDQAEDSEGPWAPWARDICSAPAPPSR